MSFDLKRLQSELSQFQKMPELLKAQGFVVKTVDSNAFIICSKNDLSPYNSNKKYEVIFSALIHGNEVGGIAVLNAVLKRILNREIMVEHSAGFCVHNTEAALQNKRFLERDLNRAFLNSDNIQLEEKLARRAENIFKDFQFCIDLHQTNQDSETPFFIFFYTNESMHWARFLDDKIPAIISNKERHKDGSTLEFFCYKNKTIGVTLELGVAGFYDQQIKYGADILSKAFLKKDFQFNKILPFKNVFKVLETIYWDKERIVLNPGFINFNSIQTNQRLGKIGESEYLSPHTGVILFPKYGEIAENTKEVFTIAEPIHNPSDFHK